jgi:hypothetical protein
MKTTSQIFAASAAMALVLFATAGRADSDASIEWKTYSQVASPGDGILSCTGLKNTITQIETDLAQMEHVRNVIEHKLDSASQMQGNSSNNSFGSAHGAQKVRELIQIRNDVNASRQTAKDRIVYLNTLLPNCRDATPPSK